MDSQKLSARLRQPGHDRSFRESEENFIAAARQCLDPDVYEVIPNPKDLLRIFKGVDGARDLGVRPEAAIVNKRTGKRFFVEVKKQGAAGNAEERAAKHHTVQFYKTLKAAFGYDYHPYVTIFCENLATDARYTTKFPYLYEQIGIYNPSGEKVGAISHLRNKEVLFVVGPDRTAVETVFDGISAVPVEGRQPARPQPALF